MYAASYALKFTLKRAAGGIDYVVMPSEGLWWAGDMDRFSMADKADWRWTMMIAQPPEVDETLLAEVLAQTAKKKALPALARLRFEKLEEGRCAQIMHLGPYEAEAPTIAQLHESIGSAGFRRSGKHHEIYLSDPRKAAAEKMRTVLRQPMSR